MSHVATALGLHWIGLVAVADAKRQGGRFGSLRALWPRRHRPSQCRLRDCRALLLVLLAVGAAPAGATITLHSTPGNGTHYVAGEHIVTRFTSAARIDGVIGGVFNTTRMTINIGGVNRQATVTSSCCLTYTVDFRYTVTRDDVDADGITIPANSITGPTWRASGGTNIGRNHAALTNLGDHKVRGSAITITSSNPSPLSWVNLHNATLAVELAGTTFGSSVAASNFTLTATPTIAGLSVSGFTGATSGNRTATLTLSYTGTNPAGDRSFAVTVAAAAHAGSVSLTSDSIAVNLSSISASPAQLSLTEGGSGSYTVVLDDEPASTITVTPTSSNAAVTLGSSALSFTTQNWSTPQMVTVTAATDADLADEVATISNVASGSGYNGAAASVRVSVEDDDATGTDHDIDNDGLIEVDSLAKLNAVRWDLNGDGAVDSSANEMNYRSAFAGSAAADHMGCVDSDSDADGDCVGYELTADLNFDTDGDGDVDGDDPNSYANWTPIGGSYTATFHGNNHDIVNMTTSGTNRRGLFAVLGTGAVVRNLGLVDVDVDVDATTGTGNFYAGALAGGSIGTVEAVSVRGGSISVVTSLGQANAGGLVGSLTGGTVRASYSTATVFGSGLSTAVGGLVGRSQAAIAASYATGRTTGTVSTGTGNVRIGGLLGFNNTTSGTVVNSYSAGTVVRSGTAGTPLIGGLIGSNSDGTATASYWDSLTSGQSTSGAGTTQTTSRLQLPTSYDGGAPAIYAAWDTYDTDGSGTVDAADDAWDFGGHYNYPALKYSGMDVALQRNDYDADRDGLIDVDTLARLNAIRWDLNGDGAPSSGNVGNYFRSRDTFFNPLVNPSGVGLCPPTTADADDNDCLGYELLNDLDFDTDGDGRTHTAGTGDEHDAYYDGGSGWIAIGATAANSHVNYTATFDGNGHVIKNLFINRAWDYQGLFATIGAGGFVTSLGLPNVRLDAIANQAGALAGRNLGYVSAVWSSGRVDGFDNVGGLVGWMQGAGTRLVASYSTAAVVCRSTAGNAAGGGLLGYLQEAGSPEVRTSYSTGTVTGDCPAANRRGLIGYVSVIADGRVVAGYWDENLSGIPDDTNETMPEGESTADLQRPTDYGTSADDDLYEAWDDQDLDNDGATGDGEDADPWDFGYPNQHPILKYRGLAAAPQLDLQPDTAPDFVASVADLTLPGAVAAEFQLPAATAGNGAYDYDVSGLPTGLSFDEDGSGDCGQVRTVCGTPSAAGASTVTYTVSDGDSNMAASDQDTLMFAITVPAASATIAGTTPATLIETNLDGAQVMVELAGTVFDSTLSTSSFALSTSPTVVGLSLDSVARTSDTEATLTLSFDGTDFATQSTLTVRVLAAAHRFGGDQDTGTVAVAPTGGVMLSEMTLALDEDPGSTNANVGTYTAVLTGQPASTVTVTPTSSNSDVTTSGALSFSATNWNTSQTVTVTAGQDDDATDDVAHITHPVTGLPDVTSGPRVRVDVNDDDTPSLTLAATTLMAGIAEGATSTYTVVLDTQPTGPVTVTVSSSDSVVTVDADATAGGDQNTLLFNAANWNVAQTVTVRAAEDDDGESETVTLTHNPSGADYGDADTVDVSFTVTDNDTRGGTLYDSANQVLNITYLVYEDSTRHYTLRLNTEPVGGNVTVAVASSDTATATASPSSLTFTQANWDIPQAITITGVADADTTDDNTSITHTPTGADYGSVSLPSVGVRVQDTDVAGLNVIPGSLSVAEGATATYAVRLNVAPTAAVTVTVTGASAKLTVDTNTGMAGDQTTLSFGTTNWGTGQTVTVTGVADDDGEDEFVPLNHTVTGTGNYASIGLLRRPGISVRVRDDESAGVVLSPTSLAIDEGDMASYDVSLSAPPASGSVTVTVAATGSAALTVDTSTLTFTTTSWNTAQTVTVTATADHARLADAAGALTHAVTGYGTVRAGPNLPVRVANTTVDHDADADGLIDIDSLAKLNAMRWDLDGDGTASSGNETTYATAFPNARGGSVCPTATSGVACSGFELLNDLDFDTDGDGATHRNGAGDDGDDYYNGGDGWEPIGTGATSFTAHFNGNGRLVRNLFVNRSSDSNGLFGVASPPAGFYAVGLPNARVRGGRGVGALVGRSTSLRIVAAWSTGSVSGSVNVGGLAGETGLSVAIAASYSTAAVECTSTASNSGGGGLAGGQGSVRIATVETSWAAGAVTGACPNKDGLVSGGTTATASYWDATASGIPDDADADAPEGRSTADLQSPTSYAGIYANWNIDLDGDYEADDPWHFGTSSQYPSLKWRSFDPAQQFAVSVEPRGSEDSEATGRAMRIRAETTALGLLVTWQAVPGATSYLVQWRLIGQSWSSRRQAETTSTSYEIQDLDAGVYEVRVLAVVNGEIGEASATARGEVGDPPNRPPRALELGDVALDVGGEATVSLSTAFVDPDGDELRYTVAVEGSSISALVANGDQLRLRARSAGEALVSVTATDPDGMSATTRFKVDVGAILSLGSGAAAAEGGTVVLPAMLSRALPSAMEFRWRLAADGDAATADADAADHGGVGGATTIAAGATMAQIEIAIADDDEIEPAREYFAVELEVPSDPNVGLSRRGWRSLVAIQEGVCDRTPAVREELSRGWEHCLYPRPSDLAGQATLDLRGRDVSALRSDDLLQLSRLWTLDLGDNALETLPPGLLSHVPVLRSLRLDGNALETLPAGLFAGLSAPGLSELRLSGNPGAPFALAPELRRTDALPSAAGPATLRAELPLGAPFDLLLQLSVEGGETSVDELRLPVGAVASNTAVVTASGMARAMLTAPSIPATRCGEAPCYDGLLGEGTMLSLFVQPPRTTGVAPAPELLDADTLDLSGYFSASAEGGALTYTATVDDPRLASVFVVDSTLTLTANENFETGVATVTVTATDELGQTATLRFEVAVSPRMPNRWRGWRSMLTKPASP